VTRDEWREVIRAEMRNLDAPGSDRFWAPELDTAPRERLREIQSRKLVAAVEWMYARSELFRSKCEAVGLEPGDVRGIDDLTSLPITTKDEMSADLTASPPFGTFQSLTEEEWLAHGWQVFQSSGTTGAARPFRYTQFDRRLWAWNNARALHGMGIGKGRDVALLCFGYGPHVFMWGMHYALNLMGVPIVPGGVDSNSRAHMIDRYRVTLLAATPAYLLYLADVMRGQGLDPAASSVKRVVTGGEPVPSTTQARIAETWGVEVHQFYGCTEAAPSCGGYTCGAGHWLHFMDDTHVLETVDAESLQPVAPGEPGLSVVTNLFSDSSPQIRFLVGDYTTLAYETCECGRAHVRALDGFSGRADDMLNIRGVTVFPSAIEHVIRGREELGAEFEIVLTATDGLDEIELVVECVPAVPESDYEAIASALADAFRARLELRPKVTVLPPDTLPKTEFKSKRVRDLRPANDR
jgi:phenylacetate-CoA ligase